MTARAPLLALPLLLFLAAPACAPAWFGDGGAPDQLVLGSRDQGCSWSPDIAGGQCCLDHDSAYWVGGTEQDRFTADAELLACLALWGVPEEMANVYYSAVRRFGASRWHLTQTRSRRPPVD